MPTFTPDGENLKQMTTTTTLWGLAERYLAAERLELDDLELVGGGRGRVLRIAVDGPDGIDLDRLAEVSEGISRLLDAQGTLDGPYRLEVTSPGLERALKRPAHFVKSVGREVVVKAEVEGRTVTLRGVLIAADDEGFSVEDAAGPSRLAYRQVRTARTVFRWERAPKPGK